MLVIEQYPSDKGGFLLALLKEWFDSFGAMLTSIDSTSNDNTIIVGYVYKGASLVAHIDKAIYGEPMWVASDYAYLLPMLERVQNDVELVAGGSVFIWRPHQVGEGRRLAGMLLEKGLSLLQHMPRTGKTGTALYAGHLVSLAIGRPLNVLVSTTTNGMKGRAWRKGKPHEGWLGFVEAYVRAGYQNLRIVITTPYRLDKVDDNLGHTTITAPSAGKWDLVVVDESHKIFGNVDIVDTAKYSHMRMLAMGAMVVLVTATPHAQSLNQTYRQFGISSNSPFYMQGLHTFKDFFSRYGKAKTVVVGGGRAMPVYTECDDEELLPIIDNYRMTLYTTDIGYPEELMPEDVYHKVPLSETETAWAKAILDNQKPLKVSVDDGDSVLVVPMNDSHIPIMLHQIEGGTLKYVDEYSVTDPLTGIRMHGARAKVYNFVLPQDEPSKVRYIKERWGDKVDTVIMYHYVNEGKMLRKHFRNATILQGKTNAEAIDLYMYKNLIIYSMDWSVATYAQRRDRQVHLTKRKEPIKVHYICSALTSSEVYDSVVNKGEDLTYKHYRGKNRLKIRGEYREKLNPGSDKEDS